MSVPQAVSDFVRRENIDSFYREEAEADLTAARALLKDSRILVLDEATSALDSESEHHIQEALWRLFQGRTVIAIAHRLSTITGMDRIVVLDQGRIVEEGSHAALVARGGLYGQLWARQAGGFIAED